MNRLSKILLIAFTLCLQPLIATPAWNEWIESKVAANEVPVITNRQHQKTGRFQFVGPTAGIMERQDFHSHFIFSAAGRYFFTEQHAWELLRVSYDAASLTSAGGDVIAKTGYQLDAKQSRWSVSTGYLFSPLYGKYAFSENSLIHFDGYIGASLGLRFAAGQTQFTFEPVLGASHYLSEHFAIILPEFRTRIYSETRATSTWVTELQCLVGLSWIF